MSQTLSAMTQTLKNISAGLGSATPAQRAQLSGALGSLSPILGSAQQYIGNQAPSAPPVSSPAISPAPVNTPTATPPDLSYAPQEDEYTKRMRALLTKLEGFATEQPPAKGLSPEEKQSFDTEREQLKARYASALDALRRQQEKDRSRLVARYAAMGFSEPGVIEGPIASEPGIVTKALQEMGEAQKRELSAYEQGQAENLLAITKAEQEAERRARAEAAEEFQRRQEVLRRSLEQQLELVSPEYYTLGGRIFKRDPLTGQNVDVTPKEALQQTFEIERNGRKYRVTYDAEGREIGAIDLGPVKKEEAEEKLVPWSMTAAQAGLLGLTQNQAADLFNLPTPPKWFKDQMERQTQASITPDALQKMWDEARARVKNISKKSSGLLAGEEEL